MKPITGQEPAGVQVSGQWLAGVQVAGQGRLEVVVAEQEKERRLQPKESEREGREEP